MASHATPVTLDFELQNGLVQLCLLLLSQELLLSVFLLAVRAKRVWLYYLLGETCPNCSGEMYQRDDDKPGSNS